MLWGSPAEALEYSEQSLSVAITPFDEMCALHGKGCALFALRRIDESIVLISEGRRRFSAGGCLYPLVGSDTTLSVHKVLQGNIAEGIHLIEREILKQEKMGCQDHADSQRLALGQIYLHIIAGNQKLPFSVFVRNFPILLQIRVTAAARIRALMMHVLGNPHFDGAGHFAGRAQMILGLLYKAKRKRALAMQHLTKAKQIFSQLGQSPNLALVNAALAQLG